MRGGNRPRGETRGVSVLRTAQKLAMHRERGARCAVRARRARGGTPIAKNTLLTKQRKHKANLQKRKVKKVKIEQGKGTSVVPNAILYCMFKSKDRANYLRRYFAHDHVN